METSSDTLFDGELCCLQHIDGYRFSIDPVLLAHFVRLKKDEMLLDLGAGCGVLGLILLYRAEKNIQQLTAFELQKGLSELAEKNVNSNSLQHKMNVVRGDLRSMETYFPAESFSTIVCNPPFFLPGSGRKTVNEEALIARHQVQCSLKEIVAAASFVLRNRGRFYLIYPAELLTVLLRELRVKNFTVKRMRPVYSYPAPKGAARLVLLEALKNGAEGMHFEPPLYIYTEKDGDYSEEVQAMYRRNS